MFLNLLKVEIRKHYKFFCFFILIQLVCNILILNDYNFLFEYGFSIEMYSWLLVFLYVFINVYRDLFLSKDLLVHMIPIKTWRILLNKAIVFTLFLSIMWLTSLIFDLFSPYGMYNVRIVNSSSPIEGIIYFILPRIISLFSGVVIIGLSVAFGKLVNNKIIGNVIVVLSFIALTVSLYMIMKYNIINEGNVFWSIGTIAQFGFKQYAGIIALLVGNAQAEKAVDIASTIHWNSVIANFVMGIIGLFISNLIFKSKKYEIIRK